ncbi:Fibronectin type III domain protein [Terriglobus saanensis SP1PR4]|uniref:Fibronectin type III domain protein n=1 Tax=Terriglobus saanensis (strain ATCC BAA-1853 / DSM 23119 / SP1PR4) TaxID=401053 RepID=E8UZ43_TERSS|nr:Fibronectin type III domain protein [Terriglobus saanensis SP1PR4]
MAIGLGLTGCASPGLPKAPSLNLPKTANDLTAQRRGSSVHLQWTTPERNTDGLLLIPPASRKKYLAPTAEICRTETPNAIACAVTGRITTHPGAAESFDDVLPPALQAGPVRALQYRVRLLNAAGRSAPAATVLAPAGQAPPPTAGLRVRAVRQGAELAWNPVGDSVSGETVHILRSSADAPVVVKTAKKKSKIYKGPSSSQPEASQLRLEASPDPGGAVDPSIISGEKYIYTVARERSVTLAGHAYTVSSDLSTVTSSALTDTFAPRAPTGLDSIATPKSDESKVSIDLSWEPNAETDLAGYLVYRKDSVSGITAKLTPQIQPGTAFHDEVLLAGRKYIYWVTAIDRSGNESPRSSSTEETLP